MVVYTTIQNIHFNVINWCVEKHGNVKVLFHSEHVEVLSRDSSRYIVSHQVNGWIDGVGLCI